MEMKILQHYQNAMKTAYRKNRIKAFLLLAALPGAAMAQLNESINVEGKYVPEIIRIDRINTFPAPVRFNLETSPLGYEVRSVPAGFNPMLLPMPATGWRDTRKLSRYKGYVELGAGSWLNSTLSAGYRFVDDDDNTFGVRLQHNSTSLWKPEMSELTKDVKQFRYDENIGLYYSHVFKGTGRFNAAVDYHYGNFNYYGFNPFFLTYSNEEKGIKAPKQNLNDVSGRLGWESIAETDNITWNAGLGVRYFGYSDYGFEKSDNALKETDIRIDGGFNFPTSTLSSLGIDASADILLYAGEKENKVGLSSPDNYGKVTLTPYYSFKQDNLNVRIGADVDLTFGVDDYSAFHIAPDVKADFKSGPVGLFLHLLGGSRLNTLASNYELDYYQAPRITGTVTPVYTPLDGEIGAGFGPFSGFSASVAFKYRISRNEKLGGWYQSYLNMYANEGPNFDGSVPLMPVPGMAPSFSQVYYNEGGKESEINLHGASIALDLSYSLGKLLSLKASGTYQPQNGKKGYFNGYDRPRWTGNFSAEVSPVEQLKIKLAYQYRGVRNIYFRGIPKDGGDGMIPGEAIGSYRLPDITFLNLGASWSFTDAFSVWLQADNLLNRHDEWLPSLPTRGVAVTAGLSLLF